MRASVVALTGVIVISVGLLYMYNILHSNRSTVPVSLETWNKKIFIIVLSSFFLKVWSKRVS